MKFSSYLSSCRNPVIRNAWKVVLKTWNWTPSILLIKDSLSPEIINWLKISLKGRYYFWEPFIAFEKEEDAIFFKLVWFGDEQIYS
jgi:hypothetical protein